MFTESVDCCNVLNKAYWPNVLCSGARCVEVIQSCGCERKCYRTSHNEAVQIQLNNTTMTEVRQKSTTTPTRQRNHQI